MRVFSSNNKKMDYVFALLVIALTLFGIVMISSSSIVASFEKYGSNYHYVIRQIGSFMVGLILLFITSLTDYRVWRKCAPWFFFITMFLLLLVFMPGIGHKIGGSNRWIGIGNFIFQPSEIIKLSFIIYLAAFLEKKGENIRSFYSGFLPFAILVGIISLLIIKQPDFGTMSIIVITSAIMLFASGANLWHLLFGGGFLLGLSLLLIKAAPYRMQRLLVFFNPSADSQGAAYHINQALLAIGTGGLWGLGFGNSKQKYLYLPMSHTDSIFPIIAEELGFVRSGIILLIFLYLGMRGLRIAKEAPDEFSRLLVVGIISWILIQTFINIGSMLNVLPITGVPLPFISYGGSSLIALLMATGIVLNISKHSRAQ